MTVQGTEIQDVVTGVSAWYSFRGRSGIDQNCQGLKIMLGDFKGLDVKRETREMFQWAESHGKSMRI